MSDVALVLGWGSPIGLGILIVYIATAIWILTKAQGMRRK